MDDTHFIEPVVSVDMTELAVASGTGVGAGTSGTGVGAGTSETGAGTGTSGTRAGSGTGTRAGSGTGFGQGVISSSSILKAIGASLGMFERDEGV